MNIHAQSNAIQLDGINDYIQTPIVVSNSNTHWTFECWVKGAAAPNTSGGFNGPMYGGNFGIIWNHANGGYNGAATVGSTNGTFYAATFGVLSGSTWYHLAATYDGTILKSYTNGYLISSVITNGGLMSDNSFLRLGCHPTLSNYFNGQLDEVRIWNTTRTECEIRTNMNVELSGAQIGLLANYNFSQGTPNGTNTSITTILDNSGNVNTANATNFSMTGSTSNFVSNAPFNNPTASCDSKGLNFDGINDVVTTPFTIAPSLFSNITFECWVKGNAVPTNSGYSGPMYADNFGIIWNHVDPSFRSAASVVLANGNAYAASFGALSANIWYHLAATYDGTTLKSYRNGVLITSTPTSGGALYPSSNTFKLAKHPTVANFFNGTIDEVRVWTTARTCSEINTYKNDDIATPQPGLKACYHISEGTPNGNNTNNVFSTLNDASGNALHATSSNFTGNGAASNIVYGAQFTNANTNSLGSAPSITTHPSNSTVCAGINTTFSVTAVGSGLNYQWQVNNGGGFVNLTNNSTYSNVNTSTLTISSTITGMNNYTYRCLVSGSCTAFGTSNTATLTVNPGGYSVNIINPTQTICEGQNITFTSSSMGATSFQWQYNGVNMAGENGGFLTIPTVSTSNSGNYTLVIGSSCGNYTSNQATLTVASAPAISIQPISQNVCFGQSVTLNCYATGGTSYQWYLNGNPINGANLIYYTAPVLNVNQVGNYELHITGTCGNLVSSTAIITGSQNAVINTQPLSQTSCAGNSVTLSAVTTGATSFQWQYNGNNISGANSSSYTIPSTTQMSNGNYNLIVGSNCGDIATNLVSITVYDVTTIITQPVSTTSVCEGTQVQLTVGVAGSNLSYQWKKDGVDLVGQIYSTLAINPTQVSNSGYYTVLISGNCGSESSTNASVNVYPIPVPVISIVNNELICSESGATYQWYINGVGILMSNSQTFVPTQNGIYVVSVINSGNCEGTSTDFNLANLNVDSIHSEEFNVSPNPAKDFIQINFENIENNTSIELIDVVGKKVKTEKLMNKNTLLDISDLNNGLYILNINNGVTIKSTKVIKE